MRSAIIAFIRLGRIASMLLTLVCLTGTVYGVVIQAWVVAGCCLLLTAVSSYSNYQDIQKWMAESKK